jgi:hypothetical protein
VKSLPDDMALPEGFTCQDCFAFARFCAPMGIAKPENTRCDWLPSRFRLRRDLLAQFAQLRGTAPNLEPKGAA